MHACCLLTATARELWGNVGHAFITAGIQYLVHRAQPDVVFHRLDMIRRDADRWAWTAQHAESLVICGVPRLGPMLNLYRGKGFWADVLAVRQAGIPVADLFPGTHFYLEPSLDGYLARVQENPENAYVMACERQINLTLPRGRIFGAAAAAEGLDAPVMPCGSWWAPHWYGVAPAEKTLNAVAIRFDMGVPEWASAAILRHHAALTADRPTLIVAQTADDYARAEAAGLPDLVLLTEPLDYLRVLAQVYALVSFRVHTTIPALALGARVLNLRLDSRATAVDEFGVDSVPVDILQEPSFPWSHLQCGPSLDAMEPHRTRFVSLWKERMHP